MVTPTRQLVLELTREVFSKLLRRLMYVLCVGADSGKLKRLVNDGYESGRLWYLVDDGLET